MGFEPGFSKLPLFTVNPRFFQLLNQTYKTCTVCKNHEMCSIFMNNEQNGIRTHIPKLKVILLMMGFEPGTSWFLHLQSD